MERGSDVEELVAREPFENFLFNGMSMFRYSQSVISQGQY